MQNDFFNQDAYNERQQYFIEKQNQKRQIRKIGLMTGAAVICYILLQNIFVIMLSAFGFYQTYLNNPFFQTGVDIVFSIVCMLLPFLFFGKKMGKEAGVEDIVPVEKPKDKVLFVLSIPIGVAVCLLANYVVSFVLVFIEAFGVELSSPEISQPQGVSGFLLNVLRTVIVAGLVEEISFRGCMMQPLRKYGDGFAIAMSACAFGLMHGNLIQAPFALIVGIGLGYITIKTGSLVPAIIIHALNNFISTATSYLLNSSIDEELVTKIIVLFIGAIFAIGFVSSLIFVNRVRDSHSRSLGNCVLTVSEKVSAYIFNPTMIISILIMLYYTSQYISKAG